MESAGNSFQTLQYSVAGGVANLVLNRPDKRNAIDLVMRRELGEAVQAAAADADARVLVISGTGGHFCSGGDVSAMRGAQMTAEAGRSRMQSIIATAMNLLELPKPVIAAVDGVAYGAGFGMLLCADVVIATPRARMCMSFMRIGLVPDFSAAFTLPRIVGWQRAKHLMYTAAEIDGRKALEWGIASELAEPEQLQARAAEVAAAMSLMPPTAFAMTKQTLLRTYSSDLASMADREGMAQGVAFNTAYHQQAAEALMSKQPMPYTFPAAKTPESKA